MPRRSSHRAVSIRDIVDGLQAKGFKVTSDSDTDSEHYHHGHSDHLASELPTDAWNRITRAIRPPAVRLRAEETARQVQAETRTARGFELLAQYEEHLKVAADAWSQNCHWAAEAAYGQAVRCHDQLKASDR